MANNNHTNNPNIADDAIVIWPVDIFDIVDAIRADNPGKTVTWADVYNYLNTTYGEENEGWLGLFSEEDYDENFNYTTEMQEFLDDMKAFFDSMESD